MFGVKLSSLVASGVLVLGGGAMAFAQAGGPSDPPEDATDHAASTLGTLEVVPETATRAVEERGLDEGDTEDGDGTEFSNWVKSLELDGCERGLTIAANAQNGPTDFTDAVDADPDHPAFTEGNCTEGGEDEVTNTAATSAEDGQANRPDDAGEEGGRSTADDARGDAGVEESQPGADAAEQGRSNRPDDAGEQGGRDRAPERP